MLKLLVLVVLLSGCVNIKTNQYSELSPQECWRYGVKASRFVVPTGTIVSSNVGTEEDIKRECHGDGTTALFYAGCARAASGESIRFPAVDGRYEIWYINHQCTAMHEACHALYQERKHTADYEVRALNQGYEATCPVN